MSVAREAVKNFQEEFGVDVSEETVRHGLYRQGLHAQVKKKKPALSKTNIKACLEFSRKHEFWTVDDWSSMIF